MDFAKISHHGSVNGVTGSCHELHIDTNNSVLIDCGLFQGAETSPKGSDFKQLAIDFPLNRVQALVVTHIHIDHVGRIPYLLAAGFNAPIFCSKPSALLLPDVLEDSVKIGFTKNRHLIAKFIRHIKSLLVPLEYGEIRKIPLLKSDRELFIKLKPAGHILGSAYIECEIRSEPSAFKKSSANKALPEKALAVKKQKIVFSGDLGAPYAPLLPAPKSPYGCDQLVLESTYGDKKHKNRKYRQAQLKQVIERALQNRGVVLIPAFSIGRTQELLYELENIIHRYKKQFLLDSSSDKSLAKNSFNKISFNKISFNKNSFSKDSLDNNSFSDRKTWEDIEIIVDSPMASNFTKKYQKLSEFWDAEAQNRLYQGRHPLDFSQLLTINDHKTHLETVNYLKKTARPAIVISASGMCTSGRIVNYLQALLGDPRTELLFTGYQAQGTTGRKIQKFDQRLQYMEEAAVIIEKKKVPIKARIITLSGYSAHADQGNLLNFVKRMKNKPRQIRLVHGDPQAKKTLQQLLKAIYPEIDVMIPEK